MSSGPVATPPPAASKGRVFVRRFLSSIVLWTAVISALFSGHQLLSDYFFLAIIMVLAGTGLVEFYGLLERSHLVCFKEWGVCGGLLLLASTFAYLSGHGGAKLPPAKANDFETSFLILFVLGLCLRQFVARSNTAGLIAISTTLFGLMYIPWLLNFIQKIKFLEADGRFYVFYFVVVTKFSDIGAYAVGTVIGRHKMIPRISPGKTWEGLGGALAAATASSLVFARLAGGRLPGMTAAHATVLGLLLGGTAVIGDLIESLFKREAGVKDSGHWFPGIGGILDLLDSLLFNAPLMYLYLRHVLT
ncbi:MAG: phosphatidate cytidylyltransferase [Verrucomicrobia bacterium]|nr:phosphatidate cytidylyltransferase [Verrucomicrobiota bacterium]